MTFDEDDINVTGLWLVLVGMVNMVGVVVGVLLFAGG